MGLFSHPKHSTQKQAIASFLVKRSLILLPFRARIVCSLVWLDFLAAFCSCGGLISPARPFAAGFYGPSAPASAAASDLIQSCAACVFCETME